MMRKTRHRWLRLLQFGVVAIILFFLVQVLLKNWQQISEYSWQINYSRLGLSLAVQIGGLAFWAGIWRLMAVRLGAAMSLQSGIWIYALSNLAKYLPGSIWGYVGRAYLGQKKGVSQEISWFSSLLEVAVAIVASLLIFTTSLLFPPRLFPREAYAILLVAALGSFVLILPPIFNRLAVFVSRWFHRPARLSLSYGDMALFLCLGILMHILVGGAFYLFVTSIVQLSGETLPHLIAMWSFSSMVGLLSVFAPYGLGVKESTLVLLLSVHMPVGPAIAVALLSRLWVILGDILSSFLALLWKRCSSRP